MRWSGNKAVTQSVKAVKLMKQYPHALYLGWVRKERLQGQGPNCLHQRGNGEGEEMRLLQGGKPRLDSPLGCLCRHLQEDCTLSAFLSHTFERHTVAPCRPSSDGSVHVTNVRHSCDVQVMSLVCSLECFKINLYLF